MVAHASEAGITAGSEPLDSKGFIQPSMASTPGSIQGYSLTYPASHFTPEIDGTFWTSTDIKLSGKGQRHPPTPPPHTLGHDNLCQEHRQQGTHGQREAEAPQRLLIESNALPGQRVCIRNADAVSRVGTLRGSHWLVGCYKGKPTWGPFPDPQTPLPTVGALCSVAEVIQNWLLRRTYNLSKWPGTANRLGA